MASAKFGIVALLYERRPAALRPVGEGSAAHHKSPATRFFVSPRPKPRNPGPSDPSLLIPSPKLGCCVLRLYLKEFQFPFYNQNEKDIFGKR